MAVELASVCGSMGRNNKEKRYEAQEGIPPNSELDRKRYEKGTALGGGLLAALEAYRHPELAQGLDGCGNVAPGV